MAQFEPLLWERRRRQARPSRACDQGVPPIDAAVEFAGPPVGRLGRRLLSDVETYLEFYALVRQPLSRGDTG
jgi:hypothetical protein